MLIEGTKLFFKGKLFRDNAKVIRQLIIGVVIGVASMVIANKVFEINFLIACVIGGVVCGTLQPLLFKNLKAN